MWSRLEATAGVRALIVRLSFQRPVSDTKRDEKRLRMRGVCMLMLSLVSRSIV